MSPRATPFERGPLAEAGSLLRTPKRPVSGRRTTAGRVRVEASSEGLEVTLVVGGAFTFNTHREFYAAYRDCAPETRFTLDLRDTRSVDSAALGMLILLARRAESAGRVRIVNAPSRIHRILEVCGFGALFELCEAAEFRDP